MIGYLRLSGDDFSRKTLLRNDEGFFLCAFGFVLQYLKKKMNEVGMRQEDITRIILNVLSFER